MPPRMVNVGKSAADASVAHVIEAFARLRARVARRFHANLWRTRAAFAARAIGRRSARLTNIALTTAKTRADHGSRTRHARAVRRIFFVAGNEITYSPRAGRGKIAGFARLVASSRATNPVGTETRRAIARIHTTLTLGAFRTLHAAAIDIRFIAIRAAVRAAMAPVRYRIAIVSDRPAIGVRIAFDAFAIAIARIAARRARRTLRSRRFDFRTARTRRHVTIVKRHVRVVIDGFFAARPITDHLFAILGYLRRNGLTIGRWRLSADLLNVAYPRQTRRRHRRSALARVRTSPTSPRCRADQVIVNATRQSRRDDVRIPLALAAFERAGIAIVHRRRATAHQCRIFTISFEVIHFIGAARTFNPDQPQEGKQKNPSRALRRPHVRVLHTDQNEPVSMPPIRS